MQQGRLASALTLAAVGVGLLLTAAGCGGGDNDNSRQTFTVRVENLSTSATLNTSQGGKPIPLSPGAFAVHTAANPLFTAGAVADAGIEDIAEDGVPAVEVGALQSRQGVRSSGSFEAPGGTLGPPIEPGETAQFTVTASPGDRLSFATMFVQSNDLFYAPDGNGIPLFSASGTPVSGDVTGQILLWDAGTEVNEEPGVGPSQKPRQPSDDFGPAENSVVRRITDVNDGFTYPPTTQVIRVTITPQP